jgi:hypothetical protein
VNGWRVARTPVKKVIRGVLALDLAMCLHNPLLHVNRQLAA